MSYYFTPYAFFLSTANCQLCPLFHVQGSRFNIHLATLRSPLTSLSPLPFVVCLVPCALLLYTFFLPTANCQLCPLFYALGSRFNFHLSSLRSTLTSPSSSFCLVSCALCLVSFALSIYALRPTSSCQLPTANFVPCSMFKVPGSIFISPLYALRSLLSPLPCGLCRVPCVLCLVSCVLLLSFHLHKCNIINHRCIWRYQIRHPCRTISKH